MNAETELHLIDRLRAQDVSGLERLMEQYSPRLYRVAFGITRSHPDAEEVVQDTFVTLFRKIDSFEGRASLGTPFASRANRKTGMVHHNYKLFISCETAGAANRAEESAVSMTCREAIDVLADYLDQVLLSPAIAEQLDAHLRDCPPCLAYLKTYRRTHDLVGQAGRVDMPEEMKARLRRFLLEQFGKGKA